MNDALYYRHSGNFSTSGLLAGLAASLVAALVLAYAYAYILVYLPIAGYITFIISAGFGAGIGWSTISVLKRGKVRNEVVMLGAAAGIGLLALYVAWAVWVYALLRRAEADVGLLPVLTNPPVLWEVIGAINAEGAWSISGATPSGAVLWILWAVEALIILGAAGLVAKSMSGDGVFCEQCGDWCEGTEMIARTAHGNPSDVVAKIEGKDFPAVQALGPVAAGARSWMHLTLAHCKSCDETIVLSMNSVRLEKDDKGNDSEKSDTLIDRLLLTREERDAVRQMGKAIAASPPEPLAPEAGADPGTAAKA